MKRQPQHRAQWWAEGAHVHVSKSSKDRRVAGKTSEVCNGRLVVCPYAACKTNGCMGLGVSVYVFDEEHQVYEGKFFSDGTEVDYGVPSESFINGKRERAKCRWSYGADCIVIVCLGDLLRKSRRGFRWCGHKTSEKCQCACGFEHLRTGEW